MVATPLGNLEDLTLRALRILKGAAIIAAEDTRRTVKLLARYEIGVKLISYREQNHHKVLPMLLEALESGGDVALVTDAGTPGVSDPGSLLVREAAARGISVTPLPGPSAVAAALSVCGFSADRFLFEGFPPAKKNARREVLEDLKDRRITLVFFEAPHRLAESLADMAEILGDRQAVLCREMTKINEEYRRGGLKELAEAAGRGESSRGEITLVVEGASAGVKKMLSREELTALIEGDRRPVKEIASELAGMTRLTRSEVYSLILEVRARGDKSTD